MSIFVYLFIYSLFNDAVSSLDDKEFGNSLNSEIMVLGVVTPNSLVNMNQYFRVRWGFHHRG
jgi:hypothetical protein